jgi:hypothetical protein
MPKAIIAIKRKAIVKITIPKEEEIVRLIKENQQQQKKEGIKNY